MARADAAVAHAAEAERQREVVETERLHAVQAAGGVREQLASLREAKEAVGRELGEARGLIARLEERSRLAEDRLSDMEREHSLQVEQRMAAEEASRSVQREAQGEQRRLQSELISVQTARSHAEELRGQAEKEVEKVVERRGELEALLAAANDRYGTTSAELMAVSRGRAEALEKLTDALT